MNILICGGNGYIGNALVQKMLFQKHNVVSIDNNIKFKWLIPLHSESLLPLTFLSEKNKIFNKISSFKHYSLSIANSNNIETIKDILKTHKIDVIVNLAQQPSAAYSHSSLEAAIETFTNNNIGTLQMLWAVKDTSKDILYIEIESMGCTQPDINTIIPENFFSFEYYGRMSSPSIFPKRPGSLYHSSKVNNTYLLDCAHRFWNLNVVGINQAIVYGNYTDEINETKIHSPLYVDECFGTVVNRFIAQCLSDLPITVYGKGNHRRGFLSLRDSIQAIDLIIKNNKFVPAISFINQLDHVYTIKEIASKVFNSAIDNNIRPHTIKYIDTPRVENTNNFFYKPETSILRHYGFESHENFDEEFEFILEHINYKVLDLMQLLLDDVKIKW